MITVLGMALNGVFWGCFEGCFVRVPAILSIEGEQLILLICAWSLVSICTGLVDICMVGRRLGMAGMGSGAPAWAGPGA